MPQPAMGQEALNLAGYLASLDPSERQKDKLFWRDDMENYVMNKWHPLTINDIVQYVNAIAFPTLLGAFEGNYVLQISNALGTPAALVQFGAMKENKVAFDVRWFINSQTVESQIQLVWGNPLRDDVYIGSIKYVVATRKWQQMDPTSTFVDIAGSSEEIRVGSWSWMRLVIDLLNKTYSRLQTNFLDLDLSSLPLNRATGWGIGMFQCYLTGRTWGDPLYFDDARLYVNVTE